MNCSFLKSSYSETDYEPAYAVICWWDSWQTNPISNELLPRFASVTTLAGTIPIPITCTMFPVAPLHPLEFIPIRTLQINNTTTSYQPCVQPEWPIGNHIGLHTIQMKRKRNNSFTFVHCTELLHRWIEVERRREAAPLIIDDGVNSKWREFERQRLYSCKR